MREQTIENQPLALVAESNNSLRRLISTILRHQGFSVVEARTAEEAGELFTDSPDPIGLLLADYDIAENAGGLKLALQLQKRFSGLHALLFGTFAPSETELVLIRQSGMDFLSLPFSFGRLSQTLERMRAKIVPGGLLTLKLEVPRPLEPSGSRC
ncbi:MAG TPA: hypothetical protein DCY13_18220 [Verrucomicrobiales bacterium]|nr:hypothetical protein [Verrucomicrobiales bacterium]